MAAGINYVNAQYSYLPVGSLSFLIINDSRIHDFSIECYYSAPSQYEWILNPGVYYSYLYNLSNSHLFVGPVAGLIIESSYLKDKSYTPTTNYWLDRSEYISTFGRYFIGGKMMIKIGNNHYNLALHDRLLLGYYDTPESLVFKHFIEFNNMIGLTGILIF